MNLIISSARDMARLGEARLGRAGQGQAGQGMAWVGFMRPLFGVAS